MSLSVVPITTKTRWEAFVKRYCPGALFQGWPWGEVQKALLVKIWRLGIFQGKKLVGVAQVAKTEAKRGKFLHVRHGPILVSHTRKKWGVILDYLTNLARLENCWFIRVSPLLADSDETRALLGAFGLSPAPIQAMDAELCWVVDLDKPEDKLLTDMRKTTRYEIRKAKELGVEIEKTTKKQALHRFLKLYKTTAERHGFVQHSGITEEFAIFGKEEKAFLFLGKYQKQVVAGALILFDGYQAIYHHGASIPSRIPVSCLVQWEAIREAKKRGMKVYNFWGIAPENNPNHPWRGITLFKKGFGGREIRYIHAHDLPISLWYVVPRTVEVIRRIARGY